MIKDLLIPLISVALAEVGDKTQLTLFCLSAKTKNHFTLFGGAMLAFFIVDGMAVLAGDFIARLIPLIFIKTVSALLFLSFGVSFLMQKLEDQTTCSLKQPFWSGFSMIFFSEMGDKTQIASIVFASNYQCLYVFAGVITGLGLISFLTIQLGNTLYGKINSKFLHKLSGVLFILLGISTFISLLF
ncbi:MAG: TMEM165/GDT1 family protein [Candidatus Marinimicrobia bacterium]|nr:TMEM165/GDT1 family protein [Candidatus Neomarinimicrobiota bacterium]